MDKCLMLKRDNQGFERVGTIELCKEEQVMGTTIILDGEYYEIEYLIAVKPLPQFIVKDSTEY